MGRVGFVNVRIRRVAKSVKHVLSDMEVVPCRHDVTKYVMDSIIHMACRYRVGIINTYVYTSMQYAINIKLITLTGRVGCMLLTAVTVL